ncbi:MAG: hypothetical protein M1294_04520 [Firmicutes bacterium]|nr:hypothetical protein [Bacillota bacterium]
MKALQSHVTLLSHTLTSLWISLAAAVPGYWKAGRRTGRCVLLQRPVLVRAQFFFLFNFNVAAMTLHLWWVFFHRLMAGRLVVK